MFRFSIRDVLWLTVVVGIIAAWLTSSWLQAKRLALIDVLYFKNGAGAIDVSAQRLKSGQIKVLLDFGDGRDSEGKLLGKVASESTEINLNNSGEKQHVKMGR